MILLVLKKETPGQTSWESWKLPQGGRKSTMPFISIHTTKANGYLQNKSEKAQSIRESMSRLWPETKNQEAQFPAVTTASAVTLTCEGTQGKPRLVASTQKIISKLTNRKQTLGLILV